MSVQWDAGTVRMVLDPTNGLWHPMFEWRTPSGEALSVWTLSRPPLRLAGIGMKALYFHHREELYAGLAKQGWQAPLYLEEVVEACRKLDLHFQERGVQNIYETQSVVAECQEVLQDISTTRRLLEVNDMKEGESNARES